MYELAIKQVRPPTDLATDGRGSRPTLRVGAADDPAEHAADRLADEVMARLHRRDVAPRDAAGTSPATRIRRSTIGAAGGAVDETLARRINSVRRGGSRLPDDVHRAMADGFGTDLDGVRIHTGTTADALNRSLNSRAFTIGRDLFFAGGQYQPHSESGQRLLAHELAHTLQHGSGGTKASRTIRRKLAGTREALEATSGHASWRSRVGRGTYTKVLSALGGFEAAERKIVNAAKGKRRTALLPAEKRDLEARLAELEQLVKAWLAKPGRRVDSDPNNVRARKQNLTEAHKDAGDASVLDENDKEWRSHGLMMLLPRIAEEKRELERPDYVSRGAWTDKTRTGGKDNKFGGMLNRLDYVEHGTAKGVFIQDRGWVLEAGEAGKVMGIPDVDPNAGARSVAMARLAELLGVSSHIAQTDFATHTSATHTAKSELPKPRAKLGVRQALAPGKTAGSTPVIMRPEDRRSTGEIDIADPELQRGLNVIQIIDAIAGQLDRHWNNYYINSKDGRVTGVVGIDLDMAFGVDHTDIASKPKLRKGPPGQVGAFVGMPRLADKAFRDKVTAISSEDVKAALKGLISDAELAATITRFKAVREALIAMDTRAVVDRWDEKTAAMQSDPDTSYLGRLRQGVIKHEFQDGAEAKLKSAIGAQNWPNAQQGFAAMFKPLDTHVNAGTVTPREAMAIVDAAIGMMQTNEKWLKVMASLRQYVSKNERKAAPVKSSAQHYRALKADLAAQQRQARKRKEASLVTDLGKVIDELDARTRTLDQRAADIEKPQEFIKWLADRDQFLKELIEAYVKRVQQTRWAKPPRPEPARRTAPVGGHRVAPPGPRSRRATV